MIRRSWLARMHAAGAGPGELAALERLTATAGQQPQQQQPNIVPLLEAVADETFLYLVFPFAEGGELFERVHSVYPDGMPQGEAAGCFAQMVAGLLHLKRRGMTHG